jgi:hypothetical protein
MFGFRNNLLHVAKSVFFGLGRALLTGPDSAGEFLILLVQLFVETSITTPGSRRTRLMNPSRPTSSGVFLTKSSQSISRGSGRRHSPRRKVENVWLQGAGDGRAIGFAR